MTYEESIPIAEQLAEKALAKGFDVEAFLVLSEIKRFKTDVVPESNVDEHISDIGKIFVDYYYNPSEIALQKLSESFIKTISEIYHTISNPEQKKLFKDQISRINSIF